MARPLDLLTLMDPHTICVRSQSYAATGETKHIIYCTRACMTSLHALQFDSKLHASTRLVLIGRQMFTRIWSGMNCNYLFAEIWKLNFPPTSLAILQPSIEAPSWPIAGRGQVRLEAPGLDPRLEWLGVIPKTQSISANKSPGVHMIVLAG